MQLRTLAVWLSVVMIGLAVGGTAYGLPIDSTAEILKQFDDQPAADEPARVQRSDLDADRISLDENIFTHAAEGLSPLEASELLRARAHAMGRRSDDILREIAATAAARAAGIREEPAAVPGMDRGPQSPLQGAQAPHPNLTLRRLARALVNRLDDGSGAVTDAAVGSVRGIARPQAGEGDVSVLEAILNVAIDPELIEAIAKAIQPSVNQNGVVSVSAFGLRDLAIFVSPRSGGVRIMDLTGGHDVSFQYRQQPDARVPQQQMLPTGVPPDQVNNYGGGDSTAMAEILRSIKNVVDNYIINPITIIVVTLLLLFWGVFRIASRPV